ncbi:g1154 [Coccomyxa elongata]
MRLLHDSAAPAPQLDIFLIDFGTARSLHQDTNADAENKPNHTGTPLFMALSTLKHQPQGVLSDLESAFYVFLHWATHERLHWKHARFDPSFYAPEAVGMKWSAMTFEFEEKVLARIEDVKLREVAKRLQALFFPNNIYYKSVSALEFLQAINQV